MAVRVVITAYSGFAAQPIVVVPQPHRPQTQSQGKPERPALRLVR
jgi:hypothetical protein